MNVASIKPPKQCAIINHRCPDIGEQEIEALVACARSLQLKGGERVMALVAQLANDLGYAEAVATTTGSQAIHLALRAFFDSQDALVGLPSYVCRSTYDAVRLSGCTPYLLDIDPYTFSLSVKQATEISLDAVIVPHMFGIRVPVEHFLDARLLVIEDCAQRVAPFELARTEPKAHFRMLSFEASKPVTCGEGGLLLGDDLPILNRARKLRDGPYDFPEPAVCLPMTDLQAALSLVQWRRLPSFLGKRRQLADFYLRSLSQGYQQQIVPAMFAANTYHFRFLLRVDNPDAFIKAGAKHGVAFRRPVAPMGLHTLFRIDGDFPITEKALAHVVSIPLYPRLTEDEAQKVVEVVMEVLG